MTKIDFSFSEKELLIAALTIEKRILEHTDNSEEELEELAVLETELSKENIFLSRSQINELGYYLARLLDNKEKFDHLKVYELEDKLSEITALP